MKKLFSVAKVIFKLTRWFLMVIGTITVLVAMENEIGKKGGHNK